MKKKMTTVMFRGTPEQEAKLISVIEKWRGVQGSLMPILQEAQEIYGYLPIEVQRIVSLHTGVPMEEIYGVASFYSQFMLNPNGDVSISVCLGTACYVKGSADIIAEITNELGIEAGATTPDGKFSLDATRCIGACGLAPVMTINNDVYGRVKPSEIKGILEKYK